MNLLLQDLEPFWENKFTIPKQIKKHLETECKYKVYLDKQTKVISKQNNVAERISFLYQEIENLKKNQYRADISELDFDHLKSCCSPEEIEKLKTHKPNTIHAASRIPGIRPTTLLYIHNYLRRTKLFTATE